VSLNESIGVGVIINDEDDDNNTDVDSTTVLFVTGSNKINGSPVTVPMAYILFPGGTTFLDM
jgi:hypothetical protein